MFHQLRRFTAVVTVVVAAFVIAGASSALAITTDGYGSIGISGTGAPTPPPAGTPATDVVPNGSATTPGTNSGSTTGGGTSTGGGAAPAPANKTKTKGFTGRRCTKGNRTCTYYRAGRRYKVCTHRRGHKQRCRAIRMRSMFVTAIATDGAALSRATQVTTMAKAAMWRPEALQAEGFRQPMAAVGKFFRQDAQEVLLRSVIARAPSSPTASS